MRKGDNMEKVNVKEIMEEIEKEIKDKGLTDDLPKFEKSTKAQPVIKDCELSKNVSGMHMSWNVPFYFGFEEHGIKKFVKKIVQKCLCFYLKRFSVGITEFNGYSTRAANEMMIQLFDLQKRVEKLEKENESLKNLRNGDN